MPHVLQNSAGSLFSDPILTDWKGSWPWSVSGECYLTCNSSHRIPHRKPGAICSHTHSCQTPRNQWEPLGHSGPSPAPCKWSQVPYMSLYLGPWQAARQVAGSGEGGLVPGGTSTWLWPSQCGHTEMPLYACQPSDLQRCKQLWFSF